MTVPILRIVATGARNAAIRRPITRLMTQTEAPHFRCNCARCVIASIRGSGVLRPASNVARPTDFSRPPPLDPAVRVAQLETYRKWIQSELISAMRAKNQPRLRTMKALMAEIIIIQKDPKSNLTLANVFKRSVKKRDDAIAIYEREGRPDLAQTEKEELEIIKQLREESDKIVSA